MTKARVATTPAFEVNGETTIPSLVALLAAAAALPAIELSEALAAEAALPLKMASTLETLDSTTLALELKTLANELADDAAELLLDAIAEEFDGPLAAEEDAPVEAAGSAAPPPAPPAAGRFDFWAARKSRRPAVRFA